MTRRQVAERLAVDAGFVRRCLRLLHERTLAKAGGFMASHLKKAAALHAELDSVDDAELLKRAAWIVAYARTLSRVLREEQLLRDPDLVAKAAVFGVALRSGFREPETPRRGPGRPRKAPTPAGESASAGTEKPRRRPGRPRKSLEESATPGRRRRRAG